MRLARPQLSRRQPVACESSDVLGEVPSAALCYADNVLADSFGENSPSSSGFRLSENLELPGTLGYGAHSQLLSIFPCFLLSSHPRSQRHLHRADVLLLHLCAQ